ncbi:Wzz/FepE/Etk N-terminal domain-containing protein [Bacillus sonorensis]|nr:Wzz/FepE/Etk N-terminal domain-containing protein [Bacillus sonorensis]
MKENMDFKELIAILRKRTVLILVLTIGVTLISGIFQFFVLTPVYQASTQVLVHQVGEKKECHFQRYSNQPSIYTDISSAFEKSGDSGASKGRASFTGFCRQLERKNRDEQ